MQGKRREKAERLRFGRFYYRFPDGESGADVYDRLTLFEDHVSMSPCACTCLAPRRAAPGSSKVQQTVWRAQLTSKPGAYVQQWRA